MELRLHEILKLEIICIFCAATTKVHFSICQFFIQNFQVKQMGINLSRHLQNCRFGVATIKCLKVNFSSCHIFYSEMSAGLKPAKNPLKFYARYVNKLQMWCGYYKSAFKVHFGSSHIFLFFKASL
jgi:hypothetical protein